MSRTTTPITTPAYTAASLAAELKRAKAAVQQQRKQRLEAQLLLTASAKAPKRVQSRERDLITAPFGGASVAQPLKGIRLSDHGSLPFTGKLVKKKKQQQQQQQQQQQAQAAGEKESASSSSSSSTAAAAAAAREDLRMKVFSRHCKCCLQGINKGDMQFWLTQELCNWLAIHLRARLGG